MQDFKIHTDSACDINREVLSEWGIDTSALRFKFSEDDKVYTDTDMTAEEFYHRLRMGMTVTTSSVNKEEMIASFERTLRRGMDVLYLGFSSALSSTYNSARLAAEELEKSYGKNRITLIDTLSASAGQGLLLSIAADMKSKGYKKEHIADYIRDMIPKICHIFTVDDLGYLKRGGRISPETATMGTILGMKPILTVNGEGRLITISKVRGRRSAISSLANAAAKLIDSKFADGNLFISHADARRDAEELSEILKRNYGRSVSLITDIGPVIGSHSGPGTLAIFFIGNERPTKYKLK